MMEKTIQAVNALNNDDTIHAILVHGEGRAFSPGFDLKAAAERKMNNVNDWEKQLNYSSISSCSSGIHQNRPSLQSMATV